MLKSRPRVALIVETSTVYGRKILDGISKYVSTHEPWSVFLDERELNAPPPDWLSRWDGDGIICRSTTPEVAQTLQALKIPVVDLNDRYGYLGLPRVSSDMSQLGVLAAEHLVQQGFKDIAFCGYDGEKWSTSRLSGVRSVIEPTSVFESQLSNLRQGNWSQDQMALSDWISMLPKPVGIVACNDVRGLHVLDACESLGLIVPGEVSVVGIDNSETFCSLCNPPLTSVIPNAFAVGLDAAYQLDSMIRGSRAEAIDRLVLPKGIAIRQSSDSVAVPDRMVARTMRHMRDHLKESLNVSEIAKYANVSRSTLERRFRAVLGRSPHEEMANARLARALKLLSDTHWPLTRIADEVGFSHPEYLISVVRKATGLTPSQFRMTRNRS